MIKLVREFLMFFLITPIFFCSLHSYGDVETANERTVLSGDQTNGFLKVVSFVPGISSTGTKVFLVTINYSTNWQRSAVYPKVCTNLVYGIWKTATSTEVRLKSTFITNGYRSVTYSCLPDSDEKFFSFILLNLESD
ncbi:MAG: hypothetical protein PHN69_01450 [Candidatus Pacebacteria bacterium]|nr:hypothetical protein [Candidatus Paceibacterota bacterium]